MFTDPFPFLPVRCGHLDGADSHAATCVLVTVLGQKNLNRRDTFYYLICDIYCFSRVTVRVRQKSSTLLLYFCLPVSSRGVRRP